MLSVGHSVLCISSYWHLMYLMSHMRYIRCHDPLLNPFEEFYIQSHYRRNRLLLEQSTRERNLMHHLMVDLHIVTQKHKVNQFACLPTYLPHRNTTKALNLHTVPITGMYCSYHSTGWGISRLTPRVRRKSVNTPLSHERLVVRTWHWGVNRLEAYIG
jgi:hypothetical protein